MKTAMRKTPVIKLLCFAEALLGLVVAFYAIKLVGARIWPYPRLFSLESGELKLGIVVFLVGACVVIDALGRFPDD
jgi:hypothetical protein